MDSKVRKGRGGVINPAGPSQLTEPDQLIQICTNKSGSR